MSRDEKIDFWGTHDPRELRRLGDRLLEESLPHVSGTLLRQEVSRQVRHELVTLGWEPEKVCEALGVTIELLEAWEEDRVKAPESLPLVLQRLGTVA